MGYLLPPGALERRLQWTDFHRDNTRPPPPSDQKGTAAKTYVSWRMSPQHYTFSRTVFRPPLNYKLSQDPSVITAFDPRSWVAGWLFSRTQAFQDAILEHEQGHYDINVLHASDLYSEMVNIHVSAFVSAQAGYDRLRDTFERLKTVEPIQTKYENDTQNGQAGIPQSHWTAALAGARQPGATLRSSLKAAGLYP